MNVYYYSIYKPFIRDFIALKRSLGYKYNNIEYAFTKFDQLATDREESSIGLSKEFCEIWGIRRPNESDKTWYNRIQIIRAFSSFLVTLDYPSFLPVLPKIKNTYTPYIYSKQEIVSLLAAADNLETKSTRYNSIVLTIPCLLRMLYGCGLRLGEALSLSCEDVNVKDRYIVVRDTKNGTDRLIPLSASLTQVISDYLNHRKFFPLRRKTNLLFVHPNGDSCDSHKVYKWFRKVLFQAGITHKGKHQGPHLHHLRHTFSVHSLAKMAEGGMDLYYSLPILSTYLGHTSIASTDAYVRLTSEMYPSILTKVNNVCPYLFPEIHNNNNHEDR